MVRSHFYLICYDISDPKRLSKIYRYLKTVAIPLQYSVFIAYISPLELDDILKTLASILHSRDDDIRVYPFSKQQDILSIGTPLLSDKIIYTLYNPSVPDKSK